MLKQIILITTLLTGALQYSNKRLLLIYADTKNNAELVKQQQLLHSDAAGLRNRDLEVKFFTRNENPKAFTDKHLKEPFTVILVGKDGGEKLRTHEVLSLQKLYGTIDAMPMRQQEMKHR